MGIVIGVVVAFALLLAYVRATQWHRETQRTRFAFEHRETYLLLTLEGPLGDNEAALVTMKALREALLLKVAGMDSGRALVHASGLRIANARGFRLLVGGLGPLLLNESVDLAVVSARGSRTAVHFRHSGILICLPSVREAERYLRSGRPQPRTRLAEEYVNSLLAPHRRKAA